jgi:hypothetical protein
MLQQIIIRGEVVGGHTIKDLGVTVPYDTEIPLSSVLAHRSLDLQDAYRQGHVTRVRVQTALEHQPRASSRVAPKPTRTYRRASPPASPPARPVSSSPVSAATTPHATTESGEGPQGAQNRQEDLQTRNDDLQQMTRELLVSQGEMLAQLKELLEKGISVNPVASGHVVDPKRTKAKDDYEDDDDDDDEVPIYLPSKIRSSGSKLSGTVNSKQEEGSSSGVADAAAALAALRKARKD